MESHSLGWIKLHRSLLYGGWLRNHRLTSFWVYCLLKASHKATSVFVGNQRIDLEPGQFIFGRRVAAQDMKISDRQIRTCLEALKNRQNLTIKSTNKYSLITIANWEFYQSSEEAMTSKKAYKRHAIDHIQEVKKKEKDICDISGERFEQFWRVYPARNGKKLGKREAFRKFQGLSGEDQVQCLAAVEHLAESAEAQRGIGVKDPHRFIRMANGDEPWREWVQSSIDQERPDDAPAMF